MNLRERYNESLKNLPPPGHGCHPRLLAVADYGVLAEIPAETIFQDIRRSVPSGTRKVSDREIQDAINKALSDHNGGTFTPKARPTPPIVNDWKAILRKIIDQGKISDEVDLWEASPIRLWDEPQRDTVLLLETLYRPDDLLTIRTPIGAGIIGQTIRYVSDWIPYYNSGGTTAEHIIPAPMTGRQGLTKTGEPSLQCDETVKTPYKYCVVEFDDLSREDQIRFWSAIMLPIVALIDSGSKSIHAWLDVQAWAKVETFDQWAIQIKERLYDSILTPMGVDASCKNPSRLSRLPGHFRTEKQAWQRLLWLSAKGRMICQ